MTSSGLDNVPGLGETRRKALLRHFGSLKRVAAATPEEITEVPGIGRRTAEAVLAALAPEAPAAAEPAAGEGAVPRGGAGRTKSRSTGPRAVIPPRPSDEVGSDEVGSNETGVTVD
jgi:excinuclease ABC subunit C